MVLYTPTARMAAGGTSAIESQIDLAMVEANVVFQNSRVNARLRLVHKGEIAYVESGSVSGDLFRLRTPDDGFLDEAHALRDLNAADLVCLITENGNDYWFYGLQGPSAANAFSIVRRPYLVGSYYFPVTLSFNFGCQLDRPHADSVGAFPYSYGHTFRTTDGTTYGTVDAMTGNRLHWFSNPDILFQGVPSGAWEGEANAANNAKTINLTAPIVGAFRGSALAATLPVIELLRPTGPPMRLPDRFRFWLSRQTRTRRSRASTSLGSRVRFRGWSSLARQAMRPSR
jgi:hypothetical protein